MASGTRTDRLVGMHWFSLRMVGACALLVSACSDDGVPLTGGDTDAADTGSASAGGSSDTSPGTAVTTATPTESASSSSDSDATATTDPSGPDTDGGTDGTTGGVGSSSGDTDGSTGASSSSTGGTTEPECVMDEDCMLVDDCCTCAAIAVGDDAPKCDIMSCLVSTCTSLGLDMPAVQCNFGTCEVEEVSCDPFLVTCDEKPPACPEGQAPRVVDGCYAGCIPVEFCDVVPGCESCGEDEACIESGGEKSVLSCVPIPVACDGLVSCDCLGAVCEDLFPECDDAVGPTSGAELRCSAA